MHGQVDPVEAAVCPDLQVLEEVRDGARILPVGEDPRHAGDVGVGSIQVDERTNSIVVTDVADNVDSIEKMALRLDSETPSPTEVDVRGLIEAKGWILWPPIRYSFDTINYRLTEPAPSKPTRENLLGTDDQGRDVLARLIYGFRISVLFGLCLTIVSSVIGVAAGAVQGYFGGWTDLLFQRFIEIWTSVPSLYLLLIISSVLVPSFFVLLGILLLFSWVSLVGLVRAEFLRGRNFEYIQAARALGGRADGPRRVETELQGQGLRRPAVVEIRQGLRRVQADVRFLVRESLDQSGYRRSGPLAQGAQGACGIASDKRICVSQ